MAELWPTPPLYTNRCGPAHQAISLFESRSPTARNVLIKYSLQSAIWIVFSFHCFGLVNMEMGRVGRRVFGNGGR